MAVIETSEVQYMHDFPLTRRHLPRRGRRIWSCTGWKEAPPSPAQTPALYTTGGALSPQLAKEREEDVKLHTLMEAPPPPAQTPALYKSGGALSPQPDEEREEDVELHGLDGGLSPTSSDSGSIHIWPLPHQLRLRLCTHLAVHFLLNLLRRGRRM